MHAVSSGSHQQELPLDEAFASLELQMQALREAIRTNEAVLDADWSPLPDTHAGLQQLAEFRQNLMELAMNLPKTSASLAMSGNSSEKAPPQSRVTFAGGSFGATDEPPKAVAMDGPTAPVSLQYASSAANPGGGLDRAGMLQLVGVSDAVARLVSRHAESVAPSPSAHHNAASDDIRSALRSFSTPRTLAHAYPALFAAGSEAAARPPPPVAVAASAAIEGFDSFVRSAKSSPGTDVSTPLSPSSAAVTPRMLKSLANKPLPEWARSPVARYSKLRATDDAKTLLEGMRIPEIPLAASSEIIQPLQSKATGSGLGPFAGVAEMVSVRGTGPSGVSSGMENEQEDDDTGPLSASQKYLLLRTLKPKSSGGDGESSEAHPTSSPSQGYTPSEWTGAPSHAHLLRSFQSSSNTVTDSPKAPSPPPVPASKSSRSSSPSSAARGSPEPEVAPLVIPKMRSATMTPLAAPTEPPHARKGPSAATAGHKPMPLIAPPVHSPMAEEDDSDISTPALKLSAPRVEEFEDEFVRMLDDRWKQLSEDE